MANVTSVGSESSNSPVARRHNGGIVRIERRLSRLNRIGKAAVGLCALNIEFKMVLALGQLHRIRGGNHDLLFIARPKVEHMGGMICGARVVYHLSGKAGEGPV